MSRSSWLRPLVAAVLLTGPIPSASVENEIAGALRQFVAGDAALAEAFGTAEPRAMSSRRAEVRAEAGEYLYAGTATDGALARSARDLLPFLCRVALIRHRMVPLVQISQRAPHRDSLVETTLEIAAAELRLRRVEDLRTAEVGPWRAHACRIRSADMISLLTSDRTAGLVARASYRLAKKLLASGIEDGILELLEHTTKDASVHKNAVALIVPLAANRDPNLAARLEREALDLDAVDDPDALLHYATFALTRGEWEQAGDAFERCLALRPGQPVCSEGLKTADAGAEAQARADAIDLMRRGDHE